MYTPDRYCGLRERGIRPAVADLHWDDLRMFRALARAGTVRRAARALDVHASTVTRRLEQFERVLDAKLFRRNPQGLTITDAGRDALARVETISEQIAELRRSVAGSDRRLAGRMVLAVPSVVASIAVPVVATLCRAHPDIRIEFASPSARPDIGSGEADCALMITDDPPQHLIGRRVGELAFAVYGTCGVVHARDTGATGWVELTSLRMDFRREGLADMPLWVRCPDVSTQHAALRQGMGLGPLPCLLGDPDPGLARVEPPRPAVAREIWLLAHPDLRATARIRELMRVVADAFEEARDLLLGRAGSGVD